MSTREEILAILCTARDASQPDVPRNEIVRDYTCETEDVPGSYPVLDFLIEVLGDHHIAVHGITADRIPTTIDKVLKEKEASSVIVPAGLGATWRKAAGKRRMLCVDSIGEPCTKEEFDQTLAVTTASRTMIAQSGTIILDGEPDQGHGIISPLPGLHLCVVSALTVQPTVPQAVAIVSERPIRPVIWIVGGSATLDIELVRVDGVCGPRTLIVPSMADH